MADGDNGFAVAPQTDPDPQAASASGAGAGGFMSSSASKLLIVAGAVVGLLVIAAVVAGIFFIWNASSASPGTASGPSASVTTGTSAKATQVSEETSASEATVTVPVTNDDVFSFRNPFQPTIAPAELESKASDAASEPVDPNVLTLQNIISKDGQLQAVLLFGGVTYTAGEGTILGTTPWKVLTVSESSVSMLYGDMQVTLSLGEGLKK